LSLLLSTNGFGVNVSIVEVAAREKTSPRRVARDARSSRILTPRRLRWLSPVVLILLWQLASDVGVLPESKLASPLTVLRSAVELTQTGELQSALFTSVWRVLIGFAIGAAAGLFFGVLSGLSRWGEAAVDPPLQMLRTLPHLGLIPLFILWFGIGETPKIAIVALGVAFPLYLNVFAGIRSVDQKLVEATSVLGFTRWERLRHVVAPAATEYLMVGLRLAFGIAWLSLIVGEQINADAGLGYLINNARDFLRTDIILVGLAVYAILGLGTDGVVRLIERRVLRWQTK
jgi:sulfonate transport system permease protein